MTEIFTGDCVDPGINVPGGRPILWMRFLNEDLIMFEPILSKGFSQTEFIANVIRNHIRNNLDK